mgnify:CR=1 FL=1
MATIGGTVAAVVLAAGRGERLGAPVAKPLVEFRGRPMLAHVLDAAVASGLGPVVLVVGNAGDAVAEQAAAMAPGVEVVVNPQWQEGIASSLRRALAHLGNRGIVHACVVGLADQPLIGAEAWQRVAAAYDSGATLAVATYGGVRANPVLIGRDLWPDALGLHGDRGARQLFEHHAVVDIDCSDTGTAADIDTPDDLAALDRQS